MDSEIPLEELNLSRSCIDDVGAAMLVNVLRHIFTLQSLILRGIIGITEKGLCMFADVLKPSSALRLKNLYIGSFHSLSMDDVVIYSYADALANNTSLEVLEFGLYVPKDGLERLADVLCDTSSPMTTYNSNHTLQEFICRRELPPRLMSLLNANKVVTNKAELIHLKIAGFHFIDGDSSAKVFESMSVPIIPSALSWIGRDCDQYTMMHVVLQSMPWLIESATNSNA